MERLITCPRCGLRGKLPAANPGDQLACPECRAVFTLPDGVSGSAAAPGPQVAPGPVTEDPFAVWVGEPGEQPARVVSPSGPDPQDAAAHLEWLRQETQRFNEYVVRKLALLEKRRQELANMESRAEATYLTREQELNRQQVALDARTEAVRQREQVIAARAAELDRQAESLAAQKGDIVDREAHLAGLERKIADLEKRERQLWPVVEALEGRRADAEAAQAALDRQRAALERRQAQLEREEQALRRRMEELDELEQQLRQELEEQERDLEAQRRVLAQREQVSRPSTTETPTGDRTP